MEQNLKHILSSRQFDLNFLVKLFRDTYSIINLLQTRDGKELLTHVLPGHVIGEMFWQESSRTFHSFATAASRLGANVFSERGIKKVKKQNGILKPKWELVFSSEMKDAYFEDEVRAWASFYDALILRTAEEGLVARAAEICDDFGYKVHFINAGDGKDGEHPTQTLLDLFTIFHGLGLNIESDWSRLQNHSIAFINDCKNGRTIHSLARVCGTVLGMKLIFVSPAGLEMPRHLLDELEQKKCIFEERQSLAHADVFYVTRLQKEYGGNSEHGFIVNKKAADEFCVKLIMHPFPRTKLGNELPIWRKNDSESHSVSLDKDPRAMYFKQMDFGKYARMALLKYLLNPSLEFTKLQEEKLVRSIRSQCISCHRIEYQDIGWAENSPQCGYIQTLPHIFCPNCRPKK